MASPTIIYAALERFDVSDGERWVKYLHWLGRTDLTRVVSLDAMLCPSLVRIETEADWQFAAMDYFDGFMFNFFTDLAYVSRRAAAFPRAMILAAARDPTEEEAAGFRQPDFEFAGYDVVDKRTGISALLNCGGWPEVFSLAELSPSSGLILSRERAFEVGETLHRLYPEEPHADCYVWALWLKTANE